MSRGRDERGTATVALPMLVWVATLVAVAVIDIGAYLVAAARAQAAADAAALAAVGAESASRPVAPATAAQRIAAAAGARIEACDCDRGVMRAQVRLSVPVPGLVIPRLGAGRVAATSTAVLAPPDDLAPGPTRERARWPPIGSP